MILAPAEPIKRLLAPSHSACGSRQPWSWIIPLIRSRSPQGPVCQAPSYLAVCWWCRVAQATRSWRKLEPRKRKQLEP